MTQHVGLMFCNVLMSEHKAANERFLNIIKDSDTGTLAALEI